jgi:hypothetical protein
MEARSMEDRRPPVDQRRQPPLATDDSILTYRQNVAGLWLKYGARSLKLRTYRPYKILPPMRRFVDNKR